MNVTVWDAQCSQLGNEARVPDTVKGLFYVQKNSDSKAVIVEALRETIHYSHELHFGIELRAKTKLVCRKEVLLFRVMK